MICSLRRSSLLIICGSRPGLRFWRDCWPFCFAGIQLKVRYWVWLSASLKFLLPFALLVDLGSLVPRPAVSVAGSGFSNAVVRIAVPISPEPDVAVPAHASLHRIPAAVGVVWALGFLMIALSRRRGWLRVRSALRAGTPVELPIPVRALVTAGAEEPGVVGFLRPVLILPRGLMENLDQQQLGAVLSHELCHVRRRDNFFAAVHMVVEAVFWFNPLVWWIGSRMVEERELACDEEVLRMGCEPADYVEGILRVCRFYTESPLPCVSGVTGADVKKRLRSILDGSIARELTAGRRVVLVALGLGGSLGACCGRRADCAGDSRSSRAGEHAEIRSCLDQKLSRSFATGSGRPPHTWRQFITWTADHRLCPVAANDRECVQQRPERLQPTHGRSGMDQLSVL